MMTIEEAGKLIIGTDQWSHSFDEAIAAIQLDAVKEGMRRAADVGYGTLLNDVDPEVRARAYRAILIAAEQLTEKDL